MPRIPQVSNLSRAQWISVGKNTVFAIVAAGVASLQSGSDWRAAALVAVMVGLKLVEKALTPAS